jgi:hypothetical protein
MPHRCLYHREQHTLRYNVDRKLYILSKLWEK